MQDESNCGDDYEYAGNDASQDETNCCESECDDADCPKPILAFFDIIMFRCSPRDESFGCHVDIIATSEEL